MAEESGFWRWAHENPGLLFLIIVAACWAFENIVTTGIKHGAVTTPSQPVIIAPVGSNN